MHGFGRIDIVVNAAAVLPTGPLAEASDADIDACLQTNLRGMLVVNRLAAGTLADGGTIINLSSALSRSRNAGYALYTATKAGVEAATSVLARELAPRGITVNAVAPGRTETEMFGSDLARSGDPQAARQAIVDMIPMGRIGRPDDAADLIVALCGPVRWITGQAIHVSGGIVM